VRPDQGAAIRVRLGYRKLGRAAYSSHLDLVRMLPRLFRRLELPVFYSLGFHSKPVMLFGPALSLGVASLGEYVDIKLTADASTNWDELPARLSEASIDGLEFFGARLLSTEDAKLSHTIQEATYVAALPRTSLELLGLADEAALRDRIEERCRGELRTKRVIEGIGKWVDVKRYLVEANVGRGHEFLEAAGIAGDLLPITMQLRITDSGSAKASEALETLLGQSELPARFVRARLLWRDGEQTGTPLELEHIRSVRRASALAIFENEDGLSSPAS
jgi:radical SAM-linked protein